MSRRWVFGPLLFCDHLGLKGIGVENRKGATVVPLDWRCIISLRLE